LKQRQYYNVKYRIHYKSGKTWTETKTLLCYSKIGARDMIKWLFSAKKITVISVLPTGKFTGNLILPDSHVIGDY
jgi:hypothetical protein